MPDPTPIPLIVTPGFTWTDTTPVEASPLNQAARPQVSLPPDAKIPASFLDLEDLADELGETFRARNFIVRANFWPDEWLDPAGVECPADTRTENAFGWYAEPTGGAVLVARMQDAPDERSDFAAQLKGNAGVTRVDFGTWLPAGLAGSLRAETLTFSLWVENLAGETAYITLGLAAAANLDALPTIVETDVSAAQPVPNGAWTRVSWTFHAADYDNFRNGVYLFLRTTALTSNVKTLHVAQAQLEISPVVTPFIRPAWPPPPREGFEVFPYTEQDTSSSELTVLVQNHDSGEIYALAKPPLILATPVLGWNRQANRPMWIDTTGNKLVLTYTGGDQTVEVPVGASFAEVHCWGAGGCNDAAYDTGLVKGGVGGYAKAKFPVTPGDKYTAVIGEGAHGLNRRTYGFGGKGQGMAHQHNGGGLTGLFTGTSQVQAGELARALLIAGGGGAGGQSGSGHSATAGGCGNEPSRSGGMADFQGNDASGGQTSGSGGGGGGWRGGTGLALGGRGGTSIAHSAATPVPGQAHAQGTDAVLQHAVFSSPTVPGSNLEQYTAPAGQPGRPGVMVIIFT